MVQADYRGARGANAGDDFHELWALRHALVLLDQDTGLTAVAVEGRRTKAAHRRTHGMARTVPCTTEGDKLHQPNAS